MERTSRPARGQNHTPTTSISPTDSTPRTDQAAAPDPADRPATPARKKDRRLGRGLSALISMPAATAVETAGGIALPGEAGSRVAAAVMMNLDVQNIEPNPHQPRRRFDQEALAGLAESIKANGLVQPILVRRRPQGAGEAADPRRFQLIAGERRWRAARLAGLAMVPAIVKSLQDDAMLELALVENIQRTDLNPLERAGAYQAVMRRRGWSQDDLAQRLGESRAGVGHYLRLLELPDQVQGHLTDSRLSFGHAKALMGLRQAGAQVKVAQAAVHAGWSVRQVEQLVASVLSDPAGEASLEAALGRVASARPGTAAKARPEPPPKPPNIVALEEKLTRRLGTRVVIKQGRRADMGKVLIDFYCLDDFDRVLDALGVTAD